MIPKRIFFYWDGNKLSWMRYMTLYSFKKLNPEWDVILYLSNNENNIQSWNGSEIQDFSNYDGIDYINKVEEIGIKIEKVEIPDDLKNTFSSLSPIHKSDMYRYYELSKNGGFYCDMDVLFFRPIDNFYQKITENNTDTIIYQCFANIAIGFLGSSIENNFYKDVFNFGITHLNTSNYQSLGVDLIYSMFGGNRANAFIMNKISMKYPQLNIYSIPTSLIYQYDWTKIHYNFTNPIGIEGFDQESIGYHWFGGGRISQQFNNMMNENNFRDFQTTFSEIAKKILE